ncbi:hypothetical protein [Saccharothrix sp. HUAS TT1]|uniref:hypothetical protein n=1 Tax=unclassified Saccharothrix TaxID=2593673 RepID=UPI00345C5BA3
MSVLDLAVRVATDPALRQRGLGELVGLDFPGPGFQQGRVSVQVRPARRAHAVDTALAWFYLLDRATASLRNYDTRVAVYVSGDLAGDPVQAWLSVDGTAAMLLRDAVDTASGWDPWDSADASVHLLRRVAVDVSEWSWSWC